MDAPDYDEHFMYIDVKLLTLHIYIFFFVLPKISSIVNFLAELHQYIYNAFGNVQSCQDSARLCAYTFICYFICGFSRYENDMSVHKRVFYTLLKIINHSKWYCNMAFHQIIAKCQQYHSTKFYSHSTKQILDMQKKTVQNLDSTTCQLGNTMNSNT